MCSLLNKILAPISFLCFHEFPSSIKEMGPKIRISQKNDAIAKRAFKMLVTFSIFDLCLLYSPINSF